MSNYSQGPGWWQASDGRWYPPESNPTYQQPPTAAPPQPGYGAGGFPVEHPKGTTVLILGICSLVVCGILGPVAWAMGNTALAEIDAAPGRYSNRGNVVAGRICGMVATAFMALAVVGVIILVIAAAGSSTT
ncbi:MAG: DUF4190 domain-containing protein [Acidimicrobiales bacterium]